MRRLSIAIAILAAVIAIGGCKNRREEPVPGPKAFRPAAEAIAPNSVRPSAETRGMAPRPNPDRRHGANGISWFQGTFEEAFSTNCSKCTAMFLRDALDR